MPATARRLPPYQAPIHSTPSSASSLNGIFQRLAYSRMNGTASSAPISLTSA